MFTDQKGAQGLPILVGGRQSVDPLKLEVVVSGPDDVSPVVGLFGMGEVLLEGLQGQTGSSRPRIIQHGKVLAINANCEIVSVILSPWAKGRAKFRKGVY